MDRSLSRPARVSAALTAATLFALAFLAFRGLLRGKPDEVPRDHYAHAKYVLLMNADGLPLPHRLYHYTLALAVALNPVEGWAGARVCVALVLALAVGFRGWLTHRELAPPLGGPAAAALCLLLALAMALPNWWKFPSIYGGQVNPNVWHNPTAIFAAPLALLTFTEAALLFEAPGAERALSLGVVASLCAMAKPNYLLAFLPCFGLVLAARAERRRRAGTLAVGRGAAVALLAFGPPVVTLAWQCWWSYTGDNRVVFNPLAVWRYWLRRPDLDSPPEVPPALVGAAVLVGVAFPCAVALCYPRELRRDRRTLFAWCVFAAAVAEFALLAETSVIRFYSANFAWGLVPASYILFVESCRLVGQQPGGYRAGLCYAVLTLHAASGTVYLARSLADPAGSPGF